MKAKLPAWLPASIGALVLTMYIASAAMVRPIGVTIVDEVRYFAEAEAIAQWKPLRRATSYEPTEGVGPYYPLGWPAFLAPLTLAPWPAPFALPVVLHVVGTYFFALLLQRRGLSRWWCLLYFAQPAQLLFSRTLTAESAASAWTVALMLAADSRRPGWVGFLAASSVMFKPSLTIAAVPFAMTWLVLEVPPTDRRRSTALMFASALPPIAFRIWLSCRGLAGAAPYADFITAAPTAKHILLVLVTFLLAWPFLPLGALKARTSERVGAAALIVVLFFYVYEYIGPTWAATLVVGSRLELPAVVMLLPGYAALLASFSERVRALFLGGLLAAAVITPAFLIRTLAARRTILDGIAFHTMKAVRPGCLVGYTPLAVKLLVPFPDSPQLASLAEEDLLIKTLLAGNCVDLIAPAAHLTTMEGSFNDPGSFARLLARFAHCALEPPAATRIIRMFPRGTLASCHPD